MIVRWSGEERRMICSPRILTGVLFGDNQWLRLVAYTSSTYCRQQVSIHLGNVWFRSTSGEVCLHTFNDYENINKQVIIFVSSSAEWLDGEYGHWSAKNSPINSNVSLSMATRREYSHTTYVRYTANQEWWAGRDLALPTWFNVIVPFITKQRLIILFIEHDKQTSALILLHGRQAVSQAAENGTATMVMIAWMW